MKTITTHSQEPWNKGKLVGQKAPLRLKDIWAIRVWLQIAEEARDLALFDLAIDSKLRACDLTKLRVRDVVHGQHVSSRAIVMQQKTSDLCNLRLRSKHGLPWRHGYIKPISTVRTAFFQVGCTPPSVFPPGNTPESSRRGLRLLALIQPLWYSHNETHKGIVNLSKDEEPESGSALARPYEALEYGAIPRR